MYVVEIPVYALERKLLGGRLDVQWKDQLESLGTDS
jgi:hypothetical protein